MFNKILFVTDICLFFISLFFFLIFSIGKNYFTNTTIQVCISFICVLSVILMMIFQYRKINSIRIMNAFIPLALSIALYILYHLPVFGFIGTTGIGYPKRYMRFVCFYVVFTFCFQPVRVFKNKLWVYNDIFKFKSKYTRKRRDNRCICNSENIESLRHFCIRRRYCYRNV